MTMRGGTDGNMRVYPSRARSHRPNPRARATRNYVCASWKHLLGWACGIGTGPLRGNAYSNNTHTHTGTFLVSIPKTCKRFGVCIMCMCTTPRHGWQHIHVHMYAPRTRRRIDSLCFCGRCRRYESFCGLLFACVAHCLLHATALAEYISRPAIFASL